MSTVTPGSGCVNWLFIFSRQLRIYDALSRTLLYPEQPTFVSRELQKFFVASYDALLP